MQSIVKYSHTRLNNVQNSSRMKEREVKNFGSVKNFCSSASEWVQFFWIFVAQACQMALAVALMEVLRSTQRDKGSRHSVTGS